MRNTNTLQKNCLIALLIPTVILGILPLSASNAAVYVVYALSVFGLGAVSAYVYYCMARLEDATWQTQLSNIIEKVGTGVFIADKHHQIIFSNDKLKRSLLATLVAKYGNLATLLSENEMHSQGEILNKLSGRLKIQKTWQEKHFDLVLIPLFSPKGRRFGTMVECIEKENIQGQEDSSFALSNMWEQLTIPFLFIDKSEQITYVNLSLKMILIQQQAYINERVPEFNIDHPTINSIDTFVKLFSQEAPLLNDLVMKGHLDTQFNQDDYQITFQPIWNNGNEIEGTLILWQKKVSSLKSESTSSPEAHHLGTLATLQASHPLLVLDPQHDIKQVSLAMMRLLTKDEEEISELSEQWLNINFITCVEALAPHIANHLRAALHSDEMTRFVAEHNDKICDWIITPLRVNHQLMGHTVELVYPSIEAHLALEESLARLDSKRIKIEKDLTKFTRGIAKLNLYQKEALSALDFFKPEEYCHPLLKNTSKIVQLLAGSLHKLYLQVDKLNQNLSIAPNVTKLPVDTGMNQVNMLSSSISRNVKEIQYDFNNIHQELNKLKNVIKEQRGLNQAYSKPITKALSFSENALLETIGFSEVITLVTHQLHEKQIYLNKLYHLIEKVSDASENNTLVLSEKMSKEVIVSLEALKHSLAENKHTLSHLLQDFDRLKERWGLSANNLKSCVQISQTVEQAALRWEMISDTAQEYSEHLKTRLTHLADLTDKIQTKSAQEVNEYTSERKSEGVKTPTRQFNQVVITIDENKKKAEDVLFEGLGGS